MRTSLVALAARAAFLPQDASAAYQFGDAPTLVALPPAPPALPATACFRHGPWGVRWVWDPRFVLAA